MGRPRKSEGRDTRGDILDRSLDLFSEAGFYGTSMRQIARAVGVRESALYHHFPSKTAILEELLQELGPGRAAMIGTLDMHTLVEGLGAELLLRGLIDLIIESWSTPQEMKILRIMLTEGVRLGSDGVVHIPTLLTQARRQMARVFEVLVARRLIRPADPMSLTLAMVGPLAMLRILYLSDPNQPPDMKGLKAEVKRHVDLMWTILKPEAKSKRAPRAAIRRPPARKRV